MKLVLAYQKALQTLLDFEKNLEKIARDGAGESGEGIDKVKSLLNGHELVVHCRSGVRSAKALGILKESGIEGTNVAGGILAWSEEVDPSVPQY